MACNLGDIDIENSPPIENSVVWMHLSFMPKSRSGFINDRALIEEYNIAPYFESLGTDEVTYDGPGVSPDKMYSKPQVFQTEGIDSYGPYIWQYGITDKYGEVKFDVSLDHDYWSDFVNIWGSVEGIDSIDDLVLYLRVFSTPFDGWDDFSLNRPMDLICSRDGFELDGYGGYNNIANDVYNGEEVPDLDLSRLEFITQDSTYMEGIFRMTRQNLVAAVGDYISYDLPEEDLEDDDPTDLEDDEILEDDKFDPLVIDLYVTEAKPLPSQGAPTFESLTKLYNSTELVPQPENALEQDLFSAHITWTDPAGNLVKEPFIMGIDYEEGSDSGRITISTNTLNNLYSTGKLSPGLHTLKIQVENSLYFKETPEFLVPIEIRPPHWIKFGEKNTQIDLINPFIAAYGSAFNGEELMAFESAYPHLTGAIWVQPYFDGSGELSIQDYVAINLDCITSDGSEFPLREGIMLRPGNHESLMLFDVGLGPESAYLMGLDCRLKLSFDVSYNEYEITEDVRPVSIYLVDLQLVKHPSSDNPEVIWSYFENHDTISESDNLEFKDFDYFGTQTIGGTQGGVHGVEVVMTFEAGTYTYSIDPISALLSLLGVTSIAALAVIGRRIGDDDETEILVSDTDYHDNGLFSFYPSDALEEGSEFTVIYQFEIMDYGEFKLGFVDDEMISSGFIELNIILPSGEDNFFPMMIDYTDYITTVDIGGENVAELSHGLNGLSVWNEDYITIYNLESLIELYGPITKDIVNGMPQLTFNNPVSTQVHYGLATQYKLGYGFQKQSEYLSDCVRTLRTSSDNPYEILNTQGLVNVMNIFEGDVMYIDLEDSDKETVLELYQLPLLFAPEVDFEFKIDPLVVDMLGSFYSSNDLIIDLYFVVNDGYSSYYTDTLRQPLDWISNNLEEDGSYLIHYNKDLQGLYDSFGEGTFDVYISISQEGSSPNYIPYILLTKYEYLCDEHLVEMYDKMPRDKFGDMDVNTVVNSPHYFQIFSTPLRDSPTYPYFPESPFDLEEGSDITVGIEGLPYSSLVSLDTSVSTDYAFNYLGTKETLNVNDGNFNMIPNLGLFTEGYYIDEKIS